MYYKGYGARFPEPYTEDVLFDERFGDAPEEYHWLVFYNDDQYEYVGDYYDTKEEADEAVEDLEAEGFTAYARRFEK